MRYVLEAIRALFPVASMLIGLMVLGFSFDHAAAVFCIISGVRDWWRL